MSEVVPTWEWLNPVLHSLPVLGPVGVLAAFVGAVSGGGVTVILLPVLIVYFGIREAVPIGTIALLTASISRVVVYRRRLDLPVVGWFNGGSIPATVAATYLFTITAPALLTRVFGVVLIALVAWRRLQPNPPESFTRPWFLPLGAAYGLLSGISVAMASMPAPFFLAYGLRKEAYVGTIGLSVFLGQIAKLAVFGGTNLLTATVLVQGLALAPFMVVGTMLGKRLLGRVSEPVFVAVTEAVMVVSGLAFVLRGER